MEDSRDFPKSVVAAVSVAGSTYVIIACVAYACLGSAVLWDGRPLTSYAVGSAALETLFNALLAVHVMITFVINLNVLAKNVELKLAR